MSNLNDQLSKAGRTSLLPQYFHSEEMYERFLHATQEENDEIDRAENIRGTIKLTDDSEIDKDNLSYFVVNKKMLEDEFFSELSLRITEPRAKLFCDLIRDNWQDGKTKRESPDVKKLMAGIQNYLIEYRMAKKDSIRVWNNLEEGIEANFDDDEINEILTLNKQMLTGYVPKWIDGHFKGDMMGTGDIFCRRGVYLDKLFDNEEYYEWSFINSYSFGFSVTEKFAQIGNHDKKIPAMINTLFSNIAERVLFFSPFIPGMPEKQFELGVIPHWWTQKIEHQGIHGDIHEYLVD